MFLQFLGRFLRNWDTNKTQYHPAPLILSRISFQFLLNLCLLFFRVQFCIPSCFSDSLVILTKELNASFLPVICIVILAILEGTHSCVLPYYFWKNFRRKFRHAALSHCSITAPFPFCFSNNHVTLTKQSRISKQFHPVIILSNDAIIRVSWTTSRISKY